MNAQLHDRIGTVLVALSLLAVAPRLAHAQDEGAVAVGGDVTKPMTLKPADLKTLPRTTVLVADQARTTKYEGVLLSELLTRAGAPIGAPMGSRTEATYVLVTARDGYQVVFSIGEIVDPAFTASEILLADTADGKPITIEQGPLRVIAPHDKRRTRSARMVQRIDVVRLRK